MSIEQRAYFIWPHLCDSELLLNENNLFLEFFASSNEKCDDLKEEIQQKRRKMGTNNKNSPSSERTFFNGSPSNKKSSSGNYQLQQQHQRPSPSKSINIKTPNKNQSSNVAGLANNNNNNKRLSGSCSPPNFTHFAASKCFESPSPQSLPKPPNSWFDEAGKKSGGYKAEKGKSQRARKSLNLSAESSNMSCAIEFAKQQKLFNSNDHYTQNLKLLLNVSA